MDANSKNMEIILAEYIKDPLCVYKACRCESKSYLVVMQKLPETQTNEERDGVVNAAAAKFRANILQTVFIVNMNDHSDMPSSIINYYGFGRATHYIVGKTVTPHCYSTDINEVCAGGIHYFKTYEPALMYLGPPTKYTGLRFHYYENGQMSTPYVFIDGKEVVYGIRVINELNDDGNVKTFGYATNDDKKQGSWSYYTYKGDLTIVLTAYYVNDIQLGNRRQQVYYKGDSLISSYNLDELRFVTELDDNGKTKECGLVTLNDKKQGKWCQYNYVTNDIVIKLEGYYVDDVKNGVWIERAYLNEKILLSNSNTERQIMIEMDNDNDKIKAYGCASVDKQKQDKWYHFYDIKEDLVVESEGNYINNMKNGTWTEKDINGYTTAMGKYVDDIKDGQWRMYNKGRRDGYCKYIDGKKNGFCIEKTDYGMSEGKYYEGNKSGRWVYKYDNGNVKTIMNYLNGTKDGLFELMYKNGTIKVRGTYKNNEKFGLWKVWQDVGRPKHIDGKIVNDYLKDLSNEMTEQLLD